MKVDLQLSAATMTWGQIRDGAAAADEAGFDTFWTFDHLDGRVLNGHTMIECWTLMGALAAVTSRVGLGTLVVNVANRPAGVMATAAASVQAVSGGRLRLGLGAGASPVSQWAAEQRAVGMTLRPTLAGRHEALTDALDLLDAMWRPDRDERFAGFPLPVPRPPVVLGVNSDALARVAGRRCDGVNVRGNHPDAQRFLAVANEAREGRTGPWDASVWTHWDPALVRPDHPERVRWAARGVTRLILTSLQPLAAADIATAAAQLA